MNLRHHRQLLKKFPWKFFEKKLKFVANIFSKIFDRNFSIFPKFDFRNIFDFHTKSFENENISKVKFRKILKFRSKKFEHVFEQKMKIFLKNFSTFFQKIFMGIFFKVACGDGDSSEHKSLIVLFMDGDAI